MKPVSTFLSGLLIGAPLLAEGVLAAEWERNAGITLGTYYSDNICLSNNFQKGRGAATVTPDLRIRGRGARANLYLEGSVEYDSLADSNLECPGGQRAQLTNRETVIPGLRYLGDLELIENWLTLESDAFVGRNPVDPFAAGRADQFTGRDNINITYQYGAGATLQRRFSENTGMRLRYYHNEQQNAVNLLGDSSEDRGEFDLGTDRGNNRFSMGIAGRYSKVMNEGNENTPAFDNTLSSVEARAALQLDSSWRITGLAGEEWNEFTSVRPDIDGTFWDAGLRWTPNERVEVTVGTGERFFGTTPRMSVRYRHKRSELTADYARSLTFPRNLRAAGGGFVDPTDPDLGSGPGPLPGGSMTPGSEPTFIGNTPIINDRLGIRYRFTGRRSTITIFAAESRQLRVEDLAEANFSDAGLTFSRALSATLTANAGLNWSETEGQGDNVGAFGRNSQTWRASLGFNRRLGSNTTMTMGFQRIQRKSDNAFNQYDENRATLSARHEF